MATAVVQMLQKAIRKQKNMEKALKKMEKVLKKNAEYIENTVKPLGKTDTLVFDLK
jgi:lipopolysaccharide biosynthesis regulator YciM